MCGRATHDVVDPARLEWADGIDQLLRVVEHDDVAAIVDPVRQTPIAVVKVAVR